MNGGLLNQYEFFRPIYDNFTAIDKYECMYMYIYIYVCMYVCINLPLYFGVSLYDEIHE